MMGLRDFRAFVAQLPDDAVTVFAEALNVLKIASADTTEFLHRELMSIAGWRGYTQQKARDTRMNDIDDDSLHQLLAMRMVYDIALHRKYDAPEFLHYWMQGVFCIDVRSELLLRALESKTPGIAMAGFAGFFGFPIEYIPFGQQEGQARRPVLLKPAFRIRETLSGASPDQRRLPHRIHSHLRFRLRFQPHFDA